MVRLKKMGLVFFAFGFVLIISACDDPPQVKKNLPKSNVVSGTISQPVIQNKPIKNGKNAKLVSKSNELSKEKSKIETVSEKTIVVELQEHYDAKGKIDPFAPLIQEKTEESVAVVDNRPKRPLTPLEKIELSQIKLVAVVIMKNKRIAMVEEASGKGYEVGIGTYIGKNQGRVSEIKNSSIAIKELVKDYKGRLKEHVQEIKLHKIENGE